MKPFSWFTLMVVLCVAIFLMMLSIRPAPAQYNGIYMGRDGRAHPQIIVGPDHSVWPVVPTFCYGGFGPCPVVLGAPYAPPMAYAPVAPPPPSPLGWIWGRFAPCANPECSMLTVSVQADGANVRVMPDGPVALSLANGTPVIPLQKDGNWVLVAPACSLAPTYTYSVTAGVPLSVCQ